MSKLNETIQNVEFSTVKECSKNLVQLDIDSCFNGSRNKIQELLYTGKIFTKGINKLNQMDEIMYGSATAESTYTSSLDLMKLIPNSYRSSMDKLTKISTRSYKEVKLTSYEDA
jgi:hypothetical protein